MGCAARVPPPTPCFLEVRIPEDLKWLYFHGFGDSPKVAEEFGIHPSRVGQLCKDLKADAVSQRELPLSDTGPITSDEQPEYI